LPRKTLAPPRDLLRRTAHAVVIRRLEAIP
jgi:hypothetical protein